jgi:hypothetical protein
LYHGTYYPYTETEMGGYCGPRPHDFRREELEEFGIKLERMEEAFEEGQGSCRTVEPMMMMVGELHQFLTLALYGNELSFTFTLGIYGVGGWMSPRAGLDVVVKREFPVPVGK